LLVKSKCNLMWVRWDSWPAGLRRAVTTTLGLRVGVSALLAGGWAAIEPILASILAKQPSNPILPLSYSYWGYILLGIWNRWDGYRYLLLARWGYQDAVNEANTVFYPLYPMLIRLIWKLTGLDLIAVSLLISTIATFFTFFLLYKIAEERFGARPAGLAVLCLAIYPTSMFLVGPYTESLFLSLTLASFYMAKKERWLLAGLAGALASLARGPGVYTAVALAWIAFRQWRAAGILKPAQLFCMVVGVLAPGLAGVSFLAWRSWMGFLPVSEMLEQHFSVKMVNPVYGLLYSWKMMLAAPTFTVIMEGLSALLWLGLFVIMLVNFRKYPLEWLIYMGINLLVFTSKVAMVISPLQSIGRYVLILFPGFIFLGEWLTRLTPRWRFIYILSSSTLLEVFCGLYLIGIFLG